MPQQRINLDVDQYGGLPITPIVQDGSGNGVDFTGCSAVLMVREEPTDTGTPLISISTTPNAQGSLVLGTPTTGTPPLGGVQITFTDAAKATLPTTGELLPYTCLVTFSDGTDCAVFGGYVRLDLGSAHTP